MIHIFSSHRNQTYFDSPFLYSACGIICVCGRYIELHARRSLQEYSEMNSVHAVVYMVLAIHTHEHSLAVLTASVRIHMRPYFVHSCRIVDVQMMHNLDTYIHWVNTRSVALFASKQTDRIKFALHEIVGGSLLRVVFFFVFPYSFNKLCTAAHYFFLSFP